MRIRTLAVHDGHAPCWMYDEIRKCEVLTLANCKPPIQDGTELDEQYYRKEITVVDRQMASAGLRLAKLLNDTIGKMTPGDFR
jgi:hypothetical protein